MIAGSPARIVSVSLPTCRQPFDRAACAAVTEPGSVAHGASARRTWLRGIHHLFERGLVDDVVVHESRLDQAFRNVEVTGGRMDVVLARSSVLMYVRRLSNGQRSPWAKALWNFWRSDLAADSGPMSSSRDQMMSPRLLQSSNRRVCDQADLKASLLPVASRNRKA